MFGDHELDDVIRPNPGQIRRIEGEVPVPEPEPDDIVIMGGGDNEGLLTGGEPLNLLGDGVSEITWNPPPEFVELEKRVAMLESIIKEAIGPDTFDKLVREKIRRGEGQ